MMDLFFQALNLMFIGMGFVFAFLALLVVLTSLMSKIIMHYQPPVVATAPKLSSVQQANAPAQDSDPQLKAAISAAIKQHRARRRS
ncbi:OadG family protein [Allohahella sp. A8]|uniref:OadG family protein n=1 Tax=Allohahella sp. A8 TaxID=3141461 RepID=UPI003A7F6554